MRYLGGGVGHREEFYTVAHARAQALRAPRPRARWEPTNGARLCGKAVARDSSDEDEEDEDQDEGDDRDRDEDEDRDGDESEGGGDVGNSSARAADQEDTSEDSEAMRAALELLENADEGAHESDDELQGVDAEYMEYDEDEEDEDAYEDDEYAGAGFARL